MDVVDVDALVARKPVAKPGPAVVSAGPVITVDQLLEGETGHRQDSQVIARLAKKLPIELACTRAYRSVGSMPHVLPLIREFARLNEDTRVKVFQALVGVSKGCGAMEGWTPIEDGTPDELALAQALKKGNVVRRVTRYNFCDLYLSLPPGTSGAVVDARIDFIDGKTPSKKETRVTFTYAVPGKPDPIASFSYLQSQGALADLKGAESFTKALQDDDHQLVHCIGHWSYDFFVGLFAFVFSGRWSGESRKMVFSKRPGVEKKRISLSQGKEHALLDPEKSPFATLLQDAIRKFDSITVDHDPGDHLAWVWDSLKGFDAKIARFQPLLEILPARFDHAFGDSMKDLELDIVDAYNRLEPRSTYGALSPIGYFDAIEMLEEARMYRGSESKQGLSGILNKEFKVVGLDPLGLEGSSYQFVQRYKAVISAAVATGKKVVVYTSRKVLEVAALFPEGAIKVFSNARGSPHIARDFFVEGPHDHGGGEIVILDLIPPVTAQQGANVTTSEWNAHAKVIELVQARKIPNWIAFTRLLSSREGKAAYVPDYARMEQLYAPSGVVGVSFAGVRPHNGELIVANLEKPFVGGKFRFIPASKIHGFLPLVVQVVTARIRLANEMRTWAAPLGRWGMCTKALEPVIMERAGDLASRLDSKIRAMKAESATHSSAASFGVESAVIEKVDPNAFLVQDIPHDDELPVEVLPDVGGVDA